MKFIWVTLVCLLALIMPFQSTAAEVEGRCRSGKIDIFDGIIFKTNVENRFLSTKLPFEFVFSCCEFTKVSLWSKDWCEMFVLKAFSI